MSSIQIDRDFHLHYDLYNPGGSSTVILLHGLGINAKSWVLQIPALIKAGFRIISPDIRGFGRSQFLGKLILGDMVDDIRRLINHECDSPVHLVGISMGGMLSIEFVLEFPELVEKIVLINSFAVIKMKGLKNHLYLLRRILINRMMSFENQLKVVANQILPGEDYSEIRNLFIDQVNQIPGSTYASAIRVIASVDNLDRISDIDHPILVISGDADHVVPLSAQSEMVQAMHDVKHIIIHDAGHAVIVENPKLVNQSIITHLSSDE